MDPKANRAQAAISQTKKKPFETLSSYGVTSENKSVHTHPPLLHKLVLFSFNNHYCCKLKC